MAMVAAKCLWGKSLPVILLLDWRSEAQTEKVPLYTGCGGRFASQFFFRNPLMVLEMLCEHSCWQELVLFFARNIHKQLRIM